MLQIRANHLTNFPHELGNLCQETWGDNINWAAWILLRDHLN